jgi:hypothetical protein
MSKAGQEYLKALKALDDQEWKGRAPGLLLDFAKKTPTFTAEEAWDFVCEFLAVWHD